MFRLIACLLAFVVVILCAADVEGQVFRRRRNDDGVNVRAARGANVVVNQNLGGGGGAAQSAAIGGGGVRGFRNQGFAIRGHGGIAASQAVGGHGFAVRGFSGHHHGSAAFFVPQRIQAFPVFVAPQYQLQTFAAPVCNQGFGFQSFGGGVSASAAVGY